MRGKLFIVATPIGNLKDMTSRAIETLSSVGVVYAEDTRVARKLFDKYELKTPIKIYHEHSKGNTYSQILEVLKNGQDVAIITDAGTPGISDPGGRLVEFIRDKDPSIKIIPIPGASALTTAISFSGLDAREFTFLGFPPHKKGRETFFDNVASLKVRPVIFYESTHRLIKALESISKKMGGQQRVFVAKELTKIHEEGFLGQVDEAIVHFTGERARGEFVLIIP